MLKSPLTFVLKENCHFISSCLSKCKKGNTLTIFLFNTDNTFNVYFIIFIPPHILGLLLIILLHELFLDEFDDEGGQYMAEDVLD